MSSNAITQVSCSKTFGGYQKVYSHDSEELKCKMKFSIYLPPHVEDGTKVPVMYWLSGLTCTEENFIIKSGFQRYASESGLIVVGPDTSPRECGIDGEDVDWDFGTGAGFYVDASQPKWKQHYRMYSYVTKELPQIIEDNFPVIKDKRSISGHSMGGHGALICSLKNPGKYSVATAFSPISNPTKGLWGRKCFTGYLGDNEKDWEQWDATLLVEKYNGPPLHLVIDQGAIDPYAEKDLMIENFVDACAKAKVPVVFRKQEGYDHSYYFVSTFLKDHFAHHSKILYQN